MLKSTNIHDIPVSLKRTFAVVFYDLIIILAILMLATSILLFLALLLQVSPPNPHSIFFRLYLASVIVSYYHICWRYTINNQTIGMKAWKVKLINNKASNMSINQSILRIIGGILGFGLFGMGYLITLIRYNTDKSSLADYLSNTKLVVNH